MIWMGIALALFGLGFALWVSSRNAARDQESISARFGFGGSGEAMPTRSEEEERSLLKGRLRADKEFQLAIARLGWNEALPTGSAYLLWAASIAILGSVGFTVGVVNDLTILQLGVSAFAGASLGLLGFKRLIMTRASARLSRIHAELPIMIRLLRLLLNAGLSYEMALRRLSVEGRPVAPELASEFERVVRTTDVGMPLPESLATMESRLDDIDVSRLIEVLRQLISIGGSVDRSLTSLAEDLEARQESAMREQVNKAAGKMSLIMMLFLFPALLILLAGPAIISLGRGLLEISP